MPGTLVLIATVTSTSFTDYSLGMVGSGQYTATYHVKAVDAVGLKSNFSNTASVHYGDAYKISVSDAGVVVELKLHQNYPNPFNPTTQIKYSIPSEGHVTLKIFDVLGKEIQTLVEETKTQGTYKVEFNANKLAGGIYIYRLTHAGQSLTQRMVILK